MNLPLLAKTHDVSTYYIGTSGEDSVALFKELRFFSKKELGRSGYEEWNAGNIYRGVKSNLTGILITHKSCFDVFERQKEGSTEKVDKVDYVCNCALHSVTTFDEMRLMMYNDGKIGPYELEKATDKEIIDVLSYASDYYKDKIIVHSKKLNK